jgi:hypothetical protein
MEISPQSAEDAERKLMDVFQKIMRIWGKSMGRISHRRCHILTILRQEVMFFTIIKKSLPSKKLEVSGD